MTALCFLGLPSRGSLRAFYQQLSLFSRPHQGPYPHPAKVVHGGQPMNISPPG